MEVDFHGKVFIFTAPSGAGKTTIVRHLLKTFNELAFSISVTSRKKRDREVEGVDYYFLDASEFENKIEKGEFLEYEEVYHKQYYGTLKSEVERIWGMGKHIIFDVDVKGASKIKQLFGDRCLAIFVKPPSVQTLIDRLTNRNTETPQSLQKRIARIKQELTFEGRFDKILVNDVLEVTLKEAEIMVGEFLVS